MSNAGPGFFQPSKALLQKLQEDQKQRKDASGLRFFDMPQGKDKLDKAGTCKVLVLPAYNAKGAFMKEVYSHFFRKGKGGSVYCCQYTEPAERWQCPVCYVLQLLGQHNFDVSMHAARPRAHANVLVIGYKGSDEVDRNAFPYLPHIMKGPRKLGDFLIEKANDPDFEDYYDPQRALPLKLQRTKTGPNDMDVEYDFSFLGYRMKVAQTDEGMTAIAKAMYDLDRVFPYKEEHHTDAVRLANETLQRFGFAPFDKTALPVYPESLREERQKREAERKAKQQGQAAAAPGAPAPPAPAAAPLVAPPAAPVMVAAPAPTVAAPALQPAAAPLAPAQAPLVLPPAAAAPAPEGPVALTPATSAPQVLNAGPPKDAVGDVIRDPSLFEQGGEFPRCFAYHIISPICGACPYEDACTIQTFKRVSPDAK